MTEAPSRTTPILVLAIALLMGLVALWGFYSSEGAAKARERDARLETARSQGSGPVAPSLEVLVQVAGSQNAQELIELAGVLEPVRATWVSAEIEGRIVEIPAVEYAPIKQGDLLVRLDEAMPRAELIRAEANYALSKSELERQQRLGRQSVASEAVLDRAKAEERRSYAALLESRTRLARTKISAPFDGLVNTLDLDPGAYVQPGSRIAEVLDLSTIELKVLIGDRQVRILEPGAEVQVRVDAIGNERLAGRITRVGGAPSDGGQRYPVVVTLDNARGQLRPGMLAHVLFEIGASTAIRVPVGAVQNEFELDYVYRLDEENTAHRVRVTTRPVPFRPDQLEIVQGLTEGDRVAVSPVDQLREGLRVIAR